MSTLRATTALVFALAACTPADDDGSTALTAEDVEPVATRYASLVSANYEQAHADAVVLSGAITDFVAAPSEAGLELARGAWLEARESYGRTEAYRFYDGPIDAVEGRLNAWPLDEAYIDSVEGMPDAGIINDPTSYPTIDAATLIMLNEQGGETNIAAGYHAIEFLLWGQDRSEDGPGARPWTDYATDASATLPNPERRAMYLQTAVDLLVDDLAGLVEAWSASESSNYRSEFEVSEPSEAVRRMLLGIGSLSGAELAGERIEVALATQDQEDEHSCFSDNTHRDIVVDALGIQDVYLGRLGTEQGPGLYELVATRDPVLADRLADEIAASVAAAEAIPAPFDRAIVDDRELIEATVAALRVQTDSIVEVAAMFEINLALD